MVALRNLLVTLFVCVPLAGFAHTEPASDPGAILQANQSGLL